MLSYIDIYVLIICVIIPWGRFVCFLSCPEVNELKIFATIQHSFIEKNMKI